MEPTLRRRDILIIRPVTRYEGEGIYLLSLLGAGWDIYRAGGRFTPGQDVQLSRDNPHYGRQTISVERFDETVLAIVVGAIKIHDERLFAEVFHG